MVGASLEVMDRDAKKMRGEWSFVFSNLKTNAGLDKIVEFIERQGGGQVVVSSGQEIPGKMPRNAGSMKIKFGRGH